jgi:hypothetical protein
MLEFPADRFDLAEDPRTAFVDRQRNLEERIAPLVRCSRLPYG